MSTNSYSRFHIVFVCIIINTFLLSTFFSLSSAQTTITIRLQDNVAYNSKVGTLKNLDGSLPPLPPDGYTNVVLTPQNNKLIGYFNIDRQTTISAARDVDRDELCLELDCCKVLECNLLFSVQLTIRPGEVQRRNVQLIIPDDNDNKPTFPTTSPIDIPEDAEINFSDIPLPTANDKDSPMHSVKVYTLTDNSGTFSLVMKDLKPYLKVVKSLDRESIPQYQVTLQADDGKYKESVVITIRVGDVNDNDPVLDRTDITETISENVDEGTKITTLLASDKDAGENANLVYNISNVNPSELKDHFEVMYRNSYWGIYLKRKLDYENPRDRNTVIHYIVTDKGIPTRSATGIVRVLLQDANDNAPVIEELAGYVLYEHASPNVRVKTIKVTDADTVSKNKVSCKIESNAKFRLDKNSPASSEDLTEQINYSLYSTTSFDYEVSQKESVTIECYDSASPDKVTKKTFDIPIKETNDFKPEFEKQNYYVRVYEDLAVGRNVLTVHATDKDLGKFGEVFYELDAAGSKNFTIGRDTGIIEVKHPLDREKSKSLKFYVTAKDAGESPLPLNDTAAVIVELLDVNDSPPKYEGPNMIRVTENARIGHHVTTVRFSDEDEGENGTVNFYLKVGSNIGSDYLYLHNNGTLSVIKDIDREVVPKFYVEIEANDLGKPRLSTTTTIQIMVDDENDNTPQVLRPRQGALLGIDPLIYIDVPLKSLIVSVEAEDKDNGENGTINYQLGPSNSSSLFEIHPNKGEIYTAWDPKVTPPAAGIYYVTVIVKDSGTPISLSSRCTFYIKLTAPPGLLPRFGSAGISGLVILIIIIVGTIAIAMGLIAAICWVRGRSLPPLPSDITDFEAQAKMTEDFRDYRESFAPDPHQTILKPGAQVDYVSWPRPGSPLHKDDSDQVYIRRAGAHHDYYPMEHMTRSNYTFLGPRPTNGNQSLSPRQLPNVNMHPHSHPHNLDMSTLHERRHSEDASVDDSGRGGSVEDVKTSSFTGPLTLPRSNHTLLLRPDPTAKGTMI